MPTWLLAAWNYRAVIGRAVAGFVLAACLLWIFLVLKSWHDDSKKLPQVQQQLRDREADITRLTELQKVSDSILGERDANKVAIGAVAADVRDLGNRVRLCATKSDVRVSITPAGTIEAAPDGQLRDAAEAVREFAQACAALRDLDAVNHNALIDWIERVRQPR